jgi:hypothetical protein
MSKRHLPPFTLEEDLARLQDMLPTDAMVEEFGGFLVQVHNGAAHERAHWIGVCDGYINGLKAAKQLSAGQVPDLREIVQWAAQRSASE